MINDYKYSAFISYSRSDEVFARKLHKSLEEYSLDYLLDDSENIKFSNESKTLYPVYLDQEEIPFSSDLGASLKNSLNQSASLIVLCSRKSKSSQWVAEEIKYFNNSGKSGSVFSIIVDNDFEEGITDSRDFIPTDLYSELAEPAYIAPKSLDFALNEKWFIALIANVLKQEPNELIRRNKTREQKRRRRRIYKYTASLMLLATLASQIFVDQFLSNRLFLLDDLLASNNINSAIQELLISRRMLNFDIFSNKDSLVHQREIKALESYPIEYRHSIPLQSKESITAFVDRGNNEYIVVLERQVEHNVRILRCNGLSNCDEITNQKIPLS